MAFSPRTSLVYIPVIEKTMTFTDYKVEGGEWMKEQPQGSPQTATANSLPQERNPINNIWPRDDRRNQLSVQGAPARQDRLGTAL